MFVSFIVCTVILHSAESSVFVVVVAAAVLVAIVQVIVQVVVLVCLFGVVVKKIFKCLR